MSKEVDQMVAEFKGSFHVQDRVYSRQRPELGGYILYLSADRGHTTVTWDNGVQNVVPTAFLRKTQEEAERERLRRT